MAGSRFDTAFKSNEDEGSFSLNKSLAGMQKTCPRAQLLVAAPIKYTSCCDGSMDERL
jgi:hypothetical protein